VAEGTAKYGIPLQSKETALVLRLTVWSCKPLARWCPRVSIRRRPS